MTTTTDRYRAAQQSVPAGYVVVPVEPNGQLSAEGGKMTNDEIIRGMARADQDARKPSYARSFDEIPGDDQHRIVRGMHAAVAWLEASGYRIVPVKPTEGMIDAALAEEYCRGWSRQRVLDCESYFEIMVNAAPKVAT